ncbi:hypothetical protein [Sinorhizobium medicae]|nr:hypothetical protein [Sinorhizobium medicae]
MQQEWPSQGKWQCRAIRDCHAAQSRREWRPGWTGNSSKR